MAELSLFAFWVDGVTLTVISVCGLIGSIMSIVVLLKPRVRDFFSSFLTALAICDSLFLLLAIMEIGGTNMSTWFGNHVSIHYIPYTHGALSMARTGSVYVTMSITLERYFAIVHPLKHFTLKKYLLPTTIFFSIVYNIPKFFELETFVFPYINETSIRKTSMRKNPLYEHLYNFWSKVIILEVIPYITIIILNAFIVTKIYESLKFRGRFDQAAGQGESQERNRTGIEVHRPQHQERQSQQRPTSRPRARSVVDDIGLAPKEELHRRRPSVLILDGPSHRAAANRLSGRNIQPESSQIPMIRVPQPVSRTPSVLATSFGGWKRIQVNKGSIQDREINLAITLVLISVLFVFCQSFKLIPDIYEVIYCNHDLSKPTSHCQTTDVIEMIISLSNLLVCINSSANFLVYMLRGKKFRDAFYQTYIGFVCRCCKKTPPPGDSPIVSMTVSNHHIHSVRRLNQGNNSGLALAFPSPSRSKLSSGINCRNGTRTMNVLRTESILNYTTTTSVLECDTIVSMHIGEENDQN